MNARRIICRSWDFTLEGESFEAATARLARWAARAVAAWVGREAVPAFDRETSTQSLGYAGPGDIAEDLWTGEKYSLGVPDGFVRVFNGLEYRESPSFRCNETLIFQIYDGNLRKTLFAKSRESSGEDPLRFTATSLLDPKQNPARIHHVGYWYLPPKADTAAMDLMREEYAPFAGELDRLMLKKGDS